MYVLTFACLCGLQLCLQQLQAQTVPGSLLLFLLCSHVKFTPEGKCSHQHLPPLLKQSHGVADTLYACVTFSAFLWLHVLPAANPLVLPVTFRQIPLVSLQPEVICSVLSHMQHSKHFQNGSNCRLRTISLML